MTTQAMTMRFTIGPRDGTNSATLTVYTPGGVVRGPLALPAGDAYQALLHRLAILDTDADTLTNLGGMLFSALFPPEIHDSYRATRALLAQGQRLRLILDIPADATDIAGAPWEYLYDPEANAPLALHGTSVVRYLPQPVRVPALEITPPLRVLLSAAQTEPPVDVQRELSVIQTTLAELGDRVQVTVEPNLTAEKLQNLLREDFHVWHFVGHGSVSQDGTGQLVLEDAQGAAARVDAGQVAALLASSTVRLAVLDACGSGQIRTTPMRSMATALVTAGVPAVIAMQLSVPEETTRTFAVALYQALVDGEPIDVCVTEGRKAVLLTTGHRPDWGIPIVLTRTLDGRLFAPPSATGSAGAVPTDRNRQTLLDNVDRFWIDGVLHDSLAQAVTVDLGLEQRPDAVQQSWGAVIQRPGEVSQQIPPGTHLADVFDEQGQALLILGAPGTGKTTLLLELARVLLNRAAANASVPMPVIFNLSSWAVQHGPLEEWLIEELFTRYDVPRRLGRLWVESDQVLPLLDGLDEVMEVQREACATAINAYREAHGLLPIAVCCRTAEYEALTTSLRLAGAVVVQLLAPEQVDGALAAGGAQLAGLRAAVAGDAGLRELAQTPLMLSIMMLAYRGASGAIPAGAGPAEQRARIFDAYIDAMFMRRGLPRYGRESTIRWLVWLAQQMRQHAQSVFLLEGLQPDWLSDAPARTRYTLLDRVGWGSVFALVSGAVVAILFRLAGTAATGVLTFVLCVALIIGCACALFGGRARATSPRPSLRSVSIDALISGGVGWLVGAIIFGLIVSTTTPLVSPLEAVGMGGLGSGIIFALLGGLVGRPGWHARHVAITERLHWSGRRALGVAAGSGCIVAVLGAIGSALFVIAAAGRLESQATNPLGNQLLGAGFGLLIGLFIGGGLGLVGGLIGGIVGGLEGGNVATTTRPNQGVRRSAQTAVLVGSVVGLIVGLMTWPIGLATGFITGLLFALAYGGYAVLSHLTLRLLLWRKEAMPWNYTAFLDSAADRVFLRKVGGGYIFIHRLLLEHFAASDTSVSVPRLKTLGSDPPTSEIL